MEMRVKKQIKVTDERRTPGKTALTVLFAVISVIWLLPIAIVLIIATLLILRAVTAKKDA